MTKFINKLNEFWISLWKNNVITYKCKPRQPIQEKGDSMDNTIKIIEEKTTEEQKKRLEIFRGRLQDMSKAERMELAREVMARG